MFALPLTRGANRRRLRQAGLAAFPIFGAVAASVLQGCDDRQANRVQVPEFVQRMIDVDFPADGRVHARVRGRFRIEPTTAFCTFRPGYGLDTELLNATLRQMGQNTAHEGVYRMHQANVSRECIPGRSVFIRAVPTANRQGRPYRVVLAVWQGDAACVGAIERSDGRRPGVEVVVADIDLSGRAQDNQVQERSLTGDVTDLSRVCLARFSGDRN